MQEAIDLIVDGTLTGSNRLVLVLPGSYTGNANVNKAMILQTGHPTTVAGNITLSAARAQL